MLFWQARSYLIKGIAHDSIACGSSYNGEIVFPNTVCPHLWLRKREGCEGQLGLEPTFQEYIDKLCNIFDEVKRVLKKEGTCWVNIGDTYNGNKEGKTDNKVCDYLKNTTTNLHNKKGDLPDKCLCQIPSRFAIEMTNRGWILRNEIIWHKPNCMPSSVEDRFTVDFEKVFFFVKSKKYYFEQILEPLSENTDIEYRQNLRKDKEYESKEPYEKNFPKSFNIQGKNKRTVWSITTKGFSEAHFATYPEALVEPMVKSGCPMGGTVLDVFSGSGTTGRVAIDNGRNYIGIELNPEYIEIQKRRLCQQSLFEQL